jgi:porphobilinogen synthase
MDQSYTCDVKHRFRRLRENDNLRKMVRENHLSIDDLITPIFVVEGQNIKSSTEAMPEVYRYSLDRLHEELDKLLHLGLHQVLLFGIPEQKDSIGSCAYDENGIVQKAIRYVKSYSPKFYVITDVCLCQYTDHGHCGVLTDSGCVDNDPTVTLLAKVALSHVESGADMVAPSDMMDGRIGAIRQSLDSNGFANVPIMSYAIKYHSSYYGPFRAVADSSPKQGSRSSYQMDFHNSKDVTDVARASTDQGADLIIVKPAMMYLDILHELNEAIKKPLVVYNVSGEYALLYQGIKSGIVSESIVYETMIGFKRAGAKLIITYFSKLIAEKWL